MDYVTVTSYKCTTIQSFSKGNIRKVLSRDVPPNISLVKQSKILEKILNAPKGISISISEKGKSIQSILWVKVFSDIINSKNKKLIAIVKSNFIALTKHLDRYWQKIGDVYIRV